VVIPAHVDPVVASIVFEKHLNKAISGSIGRREGWTCQVVDRLHAVVGMNAQRADNRVDPYFLWLGAEWYDLYPAQARFVRPPDPAKGRLTWNEPAIGSKWLPVIDSAQTPGGSLALHPMYTYIEEGGRVRQLLCCSMNFDYYITNHAPSDAQRWVQGRHTVAALLTRVQEALRPPAYRGPSGPDDL
jgi:hypothetical protein